MARRIPASESASGPATAPASAPASAPATGSAAGSDPEGGVAGAGSRVSDTGESRDPWFGARIATTDEAVRARREGAKPVNESPYRTDADAGEANAPGERPSPND